MERSCEEIRSKIEEIENQIKNEGREKNEREDIIIKVLSWVVGDYVDIEDLDY